MNTRRDFLIQAGMIPVSIQLARAAEAATSTAMGGLPVKSALRRDDTILRLNGDGGMGPITWTADDRQLLISGDGSGWPNEPATQYWNAQIGIISGGPSGVHIENAVGYPGVDIWDACFSGSGAFYYATGMIAVDGTTYQYLSSPAVDYGSAEESPWAGTKKSRPASDFRFTAAKLVYSSDGGRTWRNQDGSTPVKWQRLPERTRATMVFSDEPDEAFAMLSVVQMGRDYRDNRDGYVYVYGSNGNTERVRNTIALFRVPKARILDRGAYEFFTGLRADGSASWSKDIGQRGVVMTYPAETGAGAAAWGVPSVVFNAPLGLYMMVNGATRGNLFTESSTGRSRFGFWVARNPWGPWTQIYEELDWMPGGDPGARPLAPLLAPAWTSKDGRSVWLMWTDTQRTRGFGELYSDKDLYRGRTPKEWVQARLTWKQYHPYFGLNAQRLDLV